MHRFEHRFEIPEECQYVILFVKLFTTEYIAKKINSKFVDYDSEKIILPLFSENLYTHFKVIGIVVRIGDNEKTGHYVLWTKSLIDNSWLRISDNMHKKYKALPNNLNNIEQIYLSKIT